MRGTGLRRSAVSTALATITLMVLACLLPPVSHAETGDPAVESFGGCLNAQRKGDLLLLFDESKSLQGSDEPNRRVVAAHYLVDRLSENATQGKLDLSIALAAFSDDFHSVLDWTTLDAGAGTQAVQSGIDEFAERNEGVQTDYWNGLNGARSDLAKRRQATDPDRCQAIVWFSDGQFSVKLKPEAYDQNVPARTKVYAPDVKDLREKGDFTEAKRRAIENLCAPKGLADQVRVAGITLFGIGLKPKETEEEDESNFDTMRRVATGQGTAKCGSRLQPVPGSFTEVGDISDLLFAFDKILNTGQLESNGNVCERPGSEVEKCRSLGHRFVLDDSVTRVHILASSEVSGATAYLLPPGGSPIPLTKKAGNEKRASWQWLDDDRSLTVELANPDQQADLWTGEWALVFLDPDQEGTSRASITISGNIFPAWPAKDTTKLYTGETAQLKFGLADDRGQEVSPSAIKGTGTFNAELERPNSNPISVVDDRPVSQLADPNDATLDLTTIPPGPATLKLTLDLTTRGIDGRPGTQLTPQVVGIDVSILPPRGTPPVDPLIDFGSITGTADATGTLGATGPGCIWLESGAQPQIDALPDGVGTVSITSDNQAAGSCLKLADGQRQELTLRLETENGGNGALAGLVPITVVGPGAQDKPAVVQVPFTADLQQPIKPLAYGLAFVGAMVLGVGIPLLLLGLAKWFTARIPAQTLVAQAIPVRVEAGQVLRDGSPLALRDSDFTEMVPLGPRGSRTAQAGGFSLRTHTGWSPFGAGYVLVDAPGQNGLSSEYPKPFGRSRSARLPLAVHNTWVATRASDAPPGSATVLILSGLDPNGDRRRQLVDSVQSRLPGLMGELGDTEAPAAGPADPFGGPAPAAPTADPFADFDQGGWTDPFAVPTSAPPPAPAASGPTASSQAAPGPTAPGPGGSGSTSGPTQPDPWLNQPRGDTAGDATVIRPAPGQPDPADQPPRPGPPAPPAQPEPKPAAQPWSFDSAFDDDPGRS